MSLGRRIAHTRTNNFPKTSSNITRYRALVNITTTLLHPGRLTWNLQITHLERKMTFQTSMIMFHVNFPGCMPQQQGYTFLRFLAFKTDILWSIPTPNAPEIAKAFVLRWSLKAPNLSSCCWCFRNPAPVEIDKTLCMIKACMVCMVICMCIYLPIATGVKADFLPITCITWDDLGVWPFLFRQLNQNVYK